MKWLPLKTVLGILIILAYFLLAVPAFADTEDPDQRPNDLYEPEPDLPNEGGEDSTNSGDNEGAEQDGSLNTNNQNSTVNSNNTTNSKTYNKDGTFMAKYLQMYETMVLIEAHKFCVEENSH